MRLQVEKLKDDELVLDVAEKAEEFPALAELQDQGQCRFARDLRGRLRAFRAGEYVEVQGGIATSAIFVCSRCLEDVELPLEIEVDLTFAPHSEDEGLEEDEEEVELEAQDLGLIPYHGDEIDLHQALQEQVVMALPLRPLCSKGCKGLCPRCGANRNVEDCDCPAPIMNNKFAALKDFKVDR
ncbi:MAG: DUF177 domain-containing protein [Geoalkalibacter sp.]|uniref:YceD family protein n=1 Tax=Geoalkalibacter sp. TaxID=3041440 RepID=UPI003D0BD091